MAFFASQIDLTPLSIHYTEGGGGPSYLARVGIKRHVACVKLALSYANVALGRLACHCWHCARGLMNVAWTGGIVSVDEMGFVRRCQSQGS